LLAVALGSGQYVGCVASVILVDEPVGDLPGAGAHGIEEPAVVGDHEHGAPPGGQMPGEPRDRLDVEMIGRLVEEEKLRRVEQQPRERDSSALAS